MSDQAARSRGSEELARHAPWIVAAAVIAVAIPLGLVRGGPAVVLWLAFAMLSGAVLLFWEALRALLDPTAPGDAIDIDEEGVPTELDARKRLALQALRELDFERSIGRISDEDHKALSTKYRAEARLAMKAIDDDLGQWLTRAEDLLARVESPGAPGAEAKKPAADAPSDDEKKPVTSDVKCSSCEAVNDHDAVFCKRCGARIAAEVRDAT